MKNLNNLTKGLFFLVVMLVCVMTHSALAVSWKALGSAGFTTNGVIAINMDVNSNGTPYIAFMDAVTRKASVMKYNGSTWDTVGSPGFSLGAAYDIDLAFGINDTAYVAFADSLNSYKCTVMKYNGSNWVIVGTAGFSAGAAGAPHIAINSAGYVLVGFADGGNGYKATVMAFNGTSWNIVQAGFSAGQANAICFAINDKDNDRPYVAFSDASNSGKLTVMKYVFSSFVPVGTAGDEAQYISLAFDTAGVPYVAYSDLTSTSYTGSTSVVKLNGNSWSYVGTEQFTQSFASYTAIAFDGSNNPYIAYKDEGSSFKANVKKYSSGNWVAVGSVGFSSGDMYYTSLAIDNAGAPHVAYMDYANSQKATVMKYSSDFWTKPSYASPADSTSTYTGVTLNWGVVSSSAGYQLQVDTSASFNSPLFFNKYETYINSTDGNSDTQEFVTNLLFGTTYYWHVRAFNSSGDTSAWTASQRIITRDYVTLSSPTDGTDVWSGVTLNWAPHTGVLQYQWQADTVPTFNSPAIRTGINNYINSTDGNSDTQYFLTDTYFGSTYHWRVRAINAADTSSWDEVRSVNIRDYVNLSTPASGTDNWSGVTLNWAVHTGVAKYEWQADTSAVSSPAFQTGTNNYINSTDGNADTEHFLTNTYFGKTYNWRVRAINAIDTSGWSEVRTIIIRNYVTLSTPADNALNRSTAGFDLDWLAHNGISYYELNFDSSGLFNSPIFQSSLKTYINSNNGNTDTKHATGALAANTVYFWRVRALNAVDTSLWTTRAFSTGSAPIVYPDTPSIVGTSEGDTVPDTGTTLLWLPVSGSSGYQYEYDTSPNFSSPVSGTTSDTSASTGSLAPNTTYYWRVRSLDGDIPSGWSDSGTFTTETPPNTVQISGGIATEQGNPISKVIVRLSGSGNQTDTTGVDGLYNFTVSAGGDYTVIPFKGNDSLTALCVTTIDLVRTQRHILVMDTLASRYKIIAADVNVSNAVSTIDIANARAVILNNTPSFPNGRFWMFANTDFPFADTIHPFPFDTARAYDNLSADAINQNFTGIKLGDVNNTWDLLNPRMGVAGEVQFATEEYYTMPGEEIIIPVKVKDFSNIAGYQFTLSWNPDVLSFLEVRDVFVPAFYGTNRTGEGFLTTSWNDAGGATKSIDNESVAFELQFKVIGNTGSFSEIKIGSEITRSEAYNDGLELLFINVTNGIVNVGDLTTSIINYQSSIINLKVQPNPFNNSTNILFNLTKAEKVNIEIYDLLGKEVKRMEANYPAGEHKIEWEGDDKNGVPLSAGLYHIRFMAGNETQGVKVAVVK